MVGRIYLFLLQELTRHIFYSIGRIYPYLMQALTKYIFYCTPMTILSFLYVILFSAQYWMRSYQYIYKICLVCCVPMQDRQFNMYGMELLEKEKVYNNKWGKITLVQN